MDTVRLSLEGTWQLLRDGLILGAGLPIIFALGVRLWSGTVSSEPDVAVEGPSVVSKVAAVLCFLIVVLAVITGLEIIVAAGLGKVVTFDHIFPTLAPKE